MKLVCYMKESNAVCYKCTICNKKYIIDLTNHPIFKSLGDNMCILNNDAELECDQCNHIHKSDTPLIRDNQSELVKCPKCHSTQIQLMKRGWKITTGFLGSSRNERVCMRCKHKF